MGEKKNEGIAVMEQKIFTRCFAAVNVLRSGR